MRTIWFCYASKRDGLFAFRLFELVVQFKCPWNKALFSEREKAYLFKIGGKGYRLLVWWRR